MQAGEFDKELGIRTRLAFRRGGKGKGKRERGKGEGGNFTLLPSAFCLLPSELLNF
jgi:hypothetical protein